MPRNTKLNLKNFQGTILKGVEKAAKSYGKMSGWSIDLAPEYYLTCKIAEHLQKTFEDHQVALEVSVEKTLKEAKAVRRGPKNKSTSGRLDIVMYHDDDKTPSALIEVKNPVTNVSKSRLNPDIERIVSSISKNRENGSPKNHLTFGAFVFTSHQYGTQKNGGPTQSLKDLLVNIKDHAIDLAGQKCRAKLHSTKIKLIKEDIREGEEKYAWCGACIIFTPNKKAKTSKN